MQARAFLAEQQRDQLLAALKRAAAHIEEITSLGGKYHGLFGAVVADSYVEAKAAEAAIAAVEQPQATARGAA